MKPGATSPPRTQWRSSPDTSLERVAFTCVHATRSTSLFFEHLHTFRFSI
jgi:hypothetical protein